MARIWTAFGVATILHLLICIPSGQGNLSLDAKLKRREIQQREVIWTGDTSFDDFNNDGGGSHSLKKREAKTVSNIITNENPLEDSHNQLVVLWAGEDVIICLAKDMNMNSTSTLYISKDYGGKFTNVSSKLLINNSRLPTLDKFFNHHRNNGHFIFTDVVNKYIFTTTDYGDNFEAIQVQFVPDEITFDPHSDKTVIAFESDTEEQEMYLSKDFGKTWTKTHQNVKSFAWDDSVIPARLYLQRKEPSGKTLLISSDALFADPGDTRMEIKDVEEFEIKDEYMFATKQAASGNLELLISYKRGPFLPALFPNKNPAKYFHIADVTDGQIFICVTHSEYLTNLYIGNEPLDNSSPKFSLSLERIVFFKPNVSWTGSWINDVTGEAFVDLHRVDGLRGVYIASQLKSATPPTNGKFNMDEVISLVTYDQGAEWTELEPPDFDDEGQPLYCKLTNGRSSERCSLHISQRLSELYPMTRAVPILSKKSAVGIVLATGTVSSSLKGHLGVYMSTDGAVKWRQLLKGNYLYNFGDHGGIIVATKYYKVGDATNELIYSTDEGQSWETYQFTEKKIRVLGLMTEPGENTTVFFVFGSVSNKTKHSWMLIKVDFKNVFERPCATEDYKLWSPWDSKPGRHCLLGRKDVYERRIANHNCHNGGDYVREISSAVCSCERVDFECDYGYKLDLSSNNTCVPDTDTVISKATTCKPGDSFYSRSKGYRKIPGDICTGGISDELLPDRVPCTVRNESEFLLVAKRDSILRINMNDFTNRDTLPIPKSEAIIALDFDKSDNAVFWSDVNQDRIMKMNLDGGSLPETLLDTSIFSVEGLAFDWMSKNLYFCDGASSKIEVIRTNVKNVKSTRKTILEKPALDKPRGIAVHPGKSFIFWSDWSNKKPVIGRSMLDGSSVTYIVQNPTGENVIKWPNGLSVDYANNKIYWVDAYLDHMASCGMNGQNLKVFLPKDYRLGHPFAVTVYKNLVYWDDWTTRSIYFAKSDTKNVTSSISLVIPNLSRLMDLKAYGPESQSGANICSNNHNCPYLCLSANGQGSPCHCPNGFNVSGDSCVCADGKPTNADGTCGVPSEEDKGVLKCSPVQIPCKADSKCIPASFRCDYDWDCTDGEDEQHCDDLYPQCTASDKFKCDNKRCIMQKWVCDGEDDCHDQSDEKNCTNSHLPHPLTCMPHEFKCNANSSAPARCISDDYVCDGQLDCEDQSDENAEYCANKTCPEWKFSCKSKDCIVKSWICDGDKDCKDGSDEDNCPGITTTIPPLFPKTDCSSLPDVFKCVGTDQCLPSSWLCDGVQDCDDGSDELSCGNAGTATSTPASATFRPTTRCPDDHWQCDSGDCIYQTSLCDGFPDCPGKEDEQTCHNETSGCPKEHLRCGLSNVCVKASKFCDNKFDCPNKMDEAACQHGVLADITCNSGQFLCPEGMCIPKYQQCNKKEDCFDGTDEAHCEGHQTVYQVAGISIDPFEIESDHFNIEWWLDAVISSGDLEFMPSYCDIKTGNCFNSTKTIKERKFKIGHDDGRVLKPFNKYAVTVYTKKDGKIYPPAIYVNVTTAEKEPSPPTDIQVMQNTTDELCLSWKKPSNSNGIIKIYRVYFHPPVPPASIMSQTTDICISNKQSDPVFVDGGKYQFWVTAENGAGSSENSVTKDYIFNASVPEVTNLKITKISESSVTVTWSGDHENSDSYVVTLEVVSPVYPLKQKQSTNTPDITLTNLAPGTTYKMYVVPVRKNIHGTSVSIRFNTKGELLPKLTSLTATALQDINVVNVSWTTVGKSSGQTFGVYFGKSTKEISDKGARINTTSTWATIPDLESCETYLVDVGIVGPNGIGPLTESPRLVFTGMSGASSPKGVYIKSVDEENLKVFLGWKAPCKILSKPIGYNITVEETTVHHVNNFYNVSYSKNPELEFPISVQFGGHYRVTVSTTSPNGKPTSPVVFDGPAIPYPQQLQVCSECNIMTVYWSKPELDKRVSVKGEVTYVVWLSQDESFKNVQTTKKYYTTESSHTFNDILEEEIYYVAVSVQDKDGLESPRSQAIPLQQIVSSSQISISTSNALGIGVTTFVVVALLISALGVFVVRHRRLQTSFLNFASSHYSTRSGSATFQQTIEEEQDSPVIRGFSDDEPLLIA